MSSKAELEISERAGEELVGRVLADKWTIERLAGTGGMATVYEARHRNGKLVAVKVLHAHLAAHPRVRRRFLREGFLANQVGHPGAVSVLDDAVDDDGTVFLVMELLHGETLAKRVERLGRLPVSDALVTMDEILAVLVAAHEKGIVHRDLKPSNVFLTSDGEVKVLDFGIARLREDTPLVADSFATQAGGVLGTPSFMAPEQARGAWDEVDGRTDLWALGATIFAALTGRTVHNGRTPNELIIAAATQAAPPVGRFVKIPAQVAALIDRALRLDPAERWPDASTLRRELARVARGGANAGDSLGDGSSGAAVRTIGSGSIDRPWSLARHIAPAAVLGCAIGGIAVLGVTLQRHDEGRPTISDVAAPPPLRMDIAPTPSALRRAEPLEQKTEPLEAKVALAPVPPPVQKRGDKTSSSSTSPVASAYNDKAASAMTARNPSPRSVVSPSSGTSARSTAPPPPTPVSSARSTSLVEPGSRANLLDRWQ